MTEISHFLQRGGWKITRKDRNSQACSKLLPEPGTTILIGRSKSGNTCTVAWMDTSGVLRTVDNLASKGKYWEATVKNGSQYYVITVWKPDGKPTSKNGKPEIAGNVEVGRKSKLGRKPDTSMQSTWGAEAGGGGG